MRDDPDMPRLLGIVRGLADVGLLLTLLYWMLFLGVFGLWNLEDTPGWCSVYFAGAALHLLLLRKATRTRVSFEAWVVAGLLTLPIVLWMGRAGWPFAVKRIGGWNTVLDEGEVSWVLWPWLHLALCWIVWRVVRRLDFRETER